MSASCYDGDDDDATGVAVGLLRAKVGVVLLSSLL